MGGKARQGWAGEGVGCGLGVWVGGRVFVFGSSCFGFVCSDSGRTFWVGLGRFVLVVVVCDVGCVWGVCSFFLNELCVINII